MNFDDEINKIITTDNESVNKVLRNYASSLLGGNMYNLGNAVGKQVKDATGDMVYEYDLMKSHNYKYLDDYYHCKANYNAAKRGVIGRATATFLGNEKEVVDYLRNRYIKGKDFMEARHDALHDIDVNKIGRERAEMSEYNSAQDACADFREKNKSLPKKYW